MSQQHQPGQGQGPQVQGSIFPGGTPQQILNAVQNVLQVVQGIQAQVKAIEEKLEKKN